MAAQNRRYINKMRRDTIERSHRVRSGYNGYAESDIPPETEEIPESDAVEEMVSHLQSKPPDRIRGKNISGIIEELLGSFDKDTLLIAALMLLLMKEGCDKRLIIALGYILV